MCSSMFTPGGGGTGTAENIKRPPKQDEGGEDEAEQSRTRQTSMSDGET